MTPLTIPGVVRNKAVALGASAWLDGLPSLLSALEEEWSFTAGEPFGDSTEAFVTRAELADGTSAVLKLLVPRASDVARHEITVLRRVSPVAFGTGLWFAGLRVADGRREGPRADRVHHAQVGSARAALLGAGCGRGDRLRGAPDRRPR